MLLATTEFSTKFWLSTGLKQISHRLEETRKKLVWSVKEPVLHQLHFSLSFQRPKVRYVNNVTKCFHLKILREKRPLKIGFSFSFHSLGSQIMISVFFCLLFLLIFFHFPTFFANWEKLIPRILGYTFCFNRRLYIL